MDESKKRSRKMIRHKRAFSECFSVIAIGVIIFSFISACTEREIDVREAKKEIDVTSKTSYSGIVNDDQLEIDVVATFNTARGGTSTCNFTKLPQTFNPATLGTHA
jgi:hypothetical protein